MDDDTRKQIGDGFKAAIRFSFLAVDDVRSRKLERLGSLIAEIRHYRLSIGVRTFCESFYFTRDGKLAYLQDSLSITVAG